MSLENRGYRLAMVPTTKSHFRSNILYLLHPLGQNVESIWVSGRRVDRIVESTEKWYSVLEPSLVGYSEGIVVDETLSQVDKGINS